MNKEEAISNNKETITRKEALSHTFLAGLAVTFGVLGLSKTASAQPGLTAKSAKAQYLEKFPNDAPEILNLKIKDVKTPIKNISKPVSTGTPSYEEINFDEILKALESSVDGTFNIQSQSLMKANAENELPSIECKISLDIEGHEQFLKNNVETLLDQAANLLDRGIKDRSEWDNLSIRNFYLDMEIRQFIETDKIHQQEIKNGYYDQFLQEKVSLLNIENLTKDKLAEISKVFADVFEKRWNDIEIQKYIENKAKAARDAGGYERAAELSWDIYRDIASTEEFDLAIQKVNNIIQKEGLLTSKQQSDLKQALLEKQVKWEHVNRDFRLMRVQVDRKFEYLKLVAFKAENGVLNLKKRMEPLQARWCNDFYEARLRIETASKGLSEIFGYEAPVPIQKKDQTDYFDYCVLWVRNAINSVIRFSQLDQSFILPVSLRSLIAKDDAAKWGSSLKNGLSFEISELDLFKGFTHVRVKGLCLFSQTNNIKKIKINYSCIYEGIIQSEIMVPKTSYYRHNNGDKVSTDQSMIPVLRFNRIASRNFIRQPDIVGTSILNNLSPYGIWNINLPQVNANDLLTKIQIEDIYLDLHITARRATV